VGAGERSEPGGGDVGAGERSEPAGGDVT